MKINFSIVSENLAKTYGDTECVVNIERNRRYSFVEFHRLTNRIVNMMRERLELRRGDVWLNVLNNDNLSILSFFTASRAKPAPAIPTRRIAWKPRKTSWRWSNPR